MHYHLCLLTHVLTKIDDNATAIEIRQSVNVPHACEWIAFAVAVTSNLSLKNSASQKKASPSVDDCWDKRLVGDLQSGSECTLSQDHGEDEDEDEIPETRQSTVKTIAHTRLMAEDLKMFASDWGLDDVYQHAMQLESSLVNNVMSQKSRRDLFK